MKKNIFTLFLVVAFLSANGASAHERATFRIGMADYSFVVGSLNEPIFVDDKTGVDISVTRGAAPGHDHHVVAGAVEGLDQTLKVEISAGDQKRELALTPTHGKPGSYYAPFYPTVETTFSYRIFGTIDNVPINLTFTCNPAGHPVSPENKNVVQISGQVSQTYRAGSFGCPKSRSEAGFPEEMPAAAELASSIGSSKTYGTVTLVLSVIAIALAARRRK